MNNKFLYRVIFTIFLISLGASLYFIYRVNFGGGIPVVEDPNPYDFLEQSRSLDKTKRIGLGVFTPDQEEKNLASIIDFENLVNKKMEYVLFFRAWGDTDHSFPSTMVPYLKEYELTPVITWEPWKRDFDNPTTIQPEYTLSTIVSGKHDAYIKEWAIAAKNAQIPVVIRFAHEMVAKEGTKAWYPWQGEPSNYVTSFRRIVDIFRANGAANVKFLPPEDPVDTSITPILTGNSVERC